MLRKSDLHLSVEPIAGVYVLCNTEDRKCYVGQSSDVRKRIRGHVTAALAGEHANKELQADMLRLGAQMFEVQIVWASDDLEERLTKEAEYISRLQTGLPEHGYNKAWYSEGKQVLAACAAGVHAGANNGMYGRVQSVETRRKISAANVGKLVGEKTHTAKLTWELVAQLRKEARTTPKASKRQLAARYGVSVSTVQAILSGKTWRVPC